MKQAVFFGSTDRIGYVYNADMQTKLRAELDFPLEPFGYRELEASRDKLANVEYIFTTWGMPHMTKDEIAKYFPSLRAVFYGAGSVQGFAREFIESGIAVVSAWGANGYAVAEFTVSQILLAGKGYFQRLHRPSHASWDTRSAGAPYDGNFAVKVGIIGAGMIGKMVIGHLKHFGYMDVLVFDPFLPDEKAAELCVTKADLPTIFRECNVISNHLANNAETKGMINADCFAAMKPNATFINTGRGAQISESGLIAALKAEPSRAALLDVTDPEPPEASSELYTLENVFLSPHIAGTIGHEVWLMAQYMYEEYRRFDAGEPLRYGVTMKMLSTMA